jgi:shikimate dehydrogenase
MHEAEGARQGLAYRYDLIDMDPADGNFPPLKEVLQAVEEAGFAGVNVTYPFKKAVMEYLDDFSEAALAVDAVNTVVFRDGRRTGHNTDLWGFAESFRRNMEGAARGRVMLIGAGGAGGAVGHALLECGVEHLLIADTRQDAARDLAERLKQRFGDKAEVETIASVESYSGKLDGLVNATPVGMAKLPGSPFPVERLSRDMWVADVIYFPIKTELLRAAREKGCRCLPGSGMAVFQAVRSFELFTGIRPDSAAMKSTFDAFDRSAL